MYTGYREYPVGFKHDSSLCAFQLISNLLPRKKMEILKILTKGTKDADFWYEGFGYSREFENEPDEESNIAECRFPCSYFGLVPGELDT